MADSQQEEGQKAPNDPEDSDKDILAEARNALKECVDEESTERAKMLDDLRFCTLDQWPQAIRNERESDLENGPRPCLTIDKINQYIVQVVNDMRQGKPGINVRPQDDHADIETAKILKGLVRNIEDQSNADIAYATAGESAAKIGLGYFRITTEYVSEDSFDQEIFIRPIPNTFSVYLSKHIMPDGSDAERGFIAESMPLGKFKEMFPEAKHSDKDFDGLDSGVSAYWRTAETITVVEEFVIESQSETLLFLADGTTITEKDYDKWPAEGGAKPTVQNRRTTFRKQLKWRKMTGVQVLEKRDLPGKYIPIIEVVGREAWVEGRRVLWGLVRPAKDSLRMYNYFASTITEKMGLAPKTPWLAAEGQLEGLEHIWAKANRVNRPYLTYKAIDVNGNAIAAPSRVGPPPIEAALLQQMQVIEHDVQTSLGMFKAAVGETESQQSGRAILALQRESDTGTYHFGANLGVSIRHAGRIIVDMIPHYMDTKRIVRILGEDGEIQTAQLDPEQQVSHRQVQTSEGIKSIYNPGVGKFDVSITIGPNYNTKRMEAAATFVELAKGATDPASAAVMRYLSVKNSDFTYSDEAAKMLKALLPPPVLQAVSGSQQMPPEAAAKIQQLTQVAQALQQENADLQSGAKQAQAKVAADHDAKMKAVELERQVAQEEAKLAREKAEAEFSLKKWIAEQEAGLSTAKAEHEAKIAADKLAGDQQQREFDNAHKAKEQQAKEGASVAPQFAKTLESIVSTFAQAMEKNNQALATMAKAVSGERVAELTTSDGRKLRAVSRTNSAPH